MTVVVELTWDGGDQENWTVIEAGMAEKLSGLVDVPIVEFQDQSLWLHKW